jgi:S-adenosylmethionine:tRNA ribosyltransferase-isomerase
MHLSLFNFILPDSLIALRPAEPRESARLLVIRPGEQEENWHVGDLPLLLEQGDALVFNDTKVIPARLFGLRSRKESTAKIEILLHRRCDPARWAVFAKPGRKLAIGDRIVFDSLEAFVEEKTQRGEIILAFSLSGPVLNAAIVRLGEMPLPPYIASRRKTDAQDLRDYQTLYAAKEGAVAAPTAGLHFTENLLNALEKRGMERYFVTLHVGAGTFQPVTVDDTRAHIMHSEWGSLDKKTAESLNAVRRRGGRIIAVGTTSLRLLESAADENGIFHPFSGETAIFITPGYQFRAVDVLMTNFHLPRSTLFMLVSAFAGLETMQETYAHAIREKYRFYSYGDASLIFRSSLA